MSNERIFHNGNAPGAPIVGETALRQHLAKMNRSNPEGATVNDIITMLVDHPRHTYQVGSLFLQYRPEEQERFVEPGFSLLRQLKDLIKGIDGKVAVITSGSPTAAHYDPLSILRSVRRELLDLVVQQGESLQARLLSITQEARESGYALTYWNPEEVGKADPEALIDLAVQRGNDYLAEYQIDERKALALIIEHLHGQGWVVDFVDDGEDELLGKNAGGIEDLVDFAEAVEMAWVHFKHRETKATGYLTLVWGNNPIELIADYTYRDGEGFDEAVQAAQRSIWPNYPEED